MDRGKERDLTSWQMGSWEEGDERGFLVFSTGPAFKLIDTLSKFGFKLWGWGGFQHWKSEEGCLLYVCITSTTKSEKGTRKTLWDNKLDMNWKFSTPFCISSSFCMPINFSFFFFSLFSICFHLPFPIAFNYAASAFWPEEKGDFRPLFFFFFGWNKV